MHIVGNLKSTGSLKKPKESSLEVYTHFSPYSSVCSFPPQRHSEDVQGKGLVNTRMLLSSQKTRVFMEVLRWGKERFCWCILRLLEAQPACYSLDLEWSPKSQVSKALSPVNGAIWEALEPLVGGPSERKLGHRVVPLKRVLGPWTLFLLPSLPICFLALMRWVAASVMRSHHNGLHHHRPKCSVAKQPWILTTIKRLAKVNFSSLKVDYLRYFFTIMGSWLTIFEWTRVSLCLS